LRSPPASCPPPPPDELELEPRELDELLELEPPELELPELDEDPEEDDELDEEGELDDDDDELDDDELDGELELDEDEEDDEEEEEEALDDEAPDPEDAPDDDDPPADDPGVPPLPVWLPPGATGDPSQAAAMPAATSTAPCDSSMRKSRRAFSLFSSAVPSIRVSESCLWSFICQVPDAAPTSCGK